MLNYYSDDLRYRRVSDALHKYQEAHWGEVIDWAELLAIATHEWLAQQFPKIDPPEPISDNYHVQV